MPAYEFRFARDAAPWPDAFRAAHPQRLPRSERNAEPCAAANGYGLSRWLLPAEPSAQPPRQPSAVAELAVVRQIERAFR